MRCLEMVLIKVDSMDELFYNEWIGRQDGFFLFCIFFLSMTTVSILIPQIIFVSEKKKLFDDPLELRKLHRFRIPNLGGVAIFAGHLFSCLTCIQLLSLPQWSVVVAGGLIIFLIGLKDDMVSLNPFLKLGFQTLAASIVVVLADLRIEQLEEGGILLTVFFIVGVVNAINLIDGIDGLAASLGIVLTICYALLFFYSGEMEWTLISFSLTGALTGFLFFNFSPAKIFMGNSGSYLLGFFVSILSIKVINILNVIPISLGSIEIQSGFALVLSILIIPLFDTVRVFIIRILKGRSPLKADQNHIHHRLLVVGLTHSQATLTLISINLIIICLAVYLQNLTDLEIISIIVIVVLCFNGLFSLILSRKLSSLNKEGLFTEASNYVRGH